MGRGWDTVGPSAERGPGGRRAIFRRSSVHADSTIINLTAMDTGLRDYHFGSTPSTAHIYHVGTYACA